MRSLYLIQTKFYLIGQMIKGERLRRRVESLSPVYGLEKESQRDKKLILSLASFNKRYKTLDKCLNGLLNQTVKPDRIIVWLDSDINENHPDDKLLQYEKYGVEFRYTNDGLMGHKKYFYAMQEFPDDIIITVDDDILYPDDLIETLLKTHEKYPDCVCANRVHLMTWNKGKLEPYNDWLYEYRKMREPSHLLFATGGGGALYPPGSIDKRAFSADLIRENCLRADDIWLKVWELRGGVEVAYSPGSQTNPVIIRETLDGENLRRGNTLQGGNDMYLQKMQEMFRDEFEELKQSAEGNMVKE